MRYRLEKSHQYILKFIRVTVPETLVIPSLEDVVRAGTGQRSFLPFWEVPVWPEVLDHELVSVIGFGNSNIEFSVRSRGAHLIPT